MSISRMLVPFAAAVAALFSVACSAQPETFVEGTHYRELRSPQATSGEGIEVAEVFWYGCPYCYSFEPHVARWKADLPSDVNFVHLPTALGRADGVIFIRAYYAAQALNVADAVHPAIFRALHDERRNIGTEAAMAGLFERAGVDGEAFKDAFDSFGVRSRVERADQRVRAMGVNAVPTMVVDGRWQTGPSMAGGFDEALKVVDFLIEKARTSR